jgi:hypothetical protein
LLDERPQGARRSVLQFVHRFAWFQHMLKVALSVKFVKAISQLKAISANAESRVWDENHVRHLRRFEVKRLIFIYFLSARLRIRTWAAP